MEVKLIQITPEPVNVMYIAARTCYSAKTPTEMWDNVKDTDNEKKWNLVNQVLSSGHHSVAEHVYFTFAISGTDRNVTHQLVRHRPCSYSQQSQRYVEIKESRDEIREILQRDDIREMDSLADKYFVITNGIAETKYCLNALLNYRTLIERDGKKPEEARAVLPGCVKTNIVFSCNLRELIHICSLRLCTRAQLPIRQLFTEIVKQVKIVEPKLAEFLVPKCETLGFCTEHKCCGRKIHINQMKKDLRELAFEELKRINASLTQEDIKNENI